MRIAFFQHGDFGEAYRRLRAGGTEYYRDQRKSVDHVAALAERHDVTVIGIGERRHDEALGRSLRSVGIGAGEAWDPRRLAALMEDVAPEILVCRSPNRLVFGLAARRGIPVLPSFADRFATGGLRETVRNLRLSLAIARCRAPCVANHSLNASLSVARALMVPKRRVVPWDWSRVEPFGEAKRAAADPEAPTAFYAGALSEAKGVGDCLEAVRVAGARGVPLRFSFAGGGDVAAWQARAEAMGVADRVRFLGLVPNEEVRRLMNGHDVVVVPSRHEYPEGLPNTIYEGLASRSPLVISDHPSFAGRLAAGTEALVFPAGDAAALAEAILRPVGDPALYATLSGNAPGALSRLYVGCEWTRLLDMFLEDPENRTGWVARHSLAALGH